jgi:hypothetical protein
MFDLVVSSLISRGSSALIRVLIRQHYALDNYIFGCSNLYYYITIVIPVFLQTLIPNCQCESIFRYQFMAHDTLSLDIHLPTFGDGTLISSSTVLVFFNVVLNSHNRILMWCLGKWSNTCSNYGTCRDSPVSCHLYPEMGHVHSEHHTIHLLALYVIISL